MWGTLWAGGIISPANPAYTVDELAFQLKNSGAKALATQVSALTVATAAAQKVGIPEDRIILLDDERDPNARVKHFTSVRNISGATRFRRQKIKADTDLAFLVYSSGTTGVPKGVMLSHRNIVANVLQQAVAEGGHLSWNGGPDGKGDRLLAFLPFYHIYGMFWRLCAFITQPFFCFCFCFFFQISGLELTHPQKVSRVSSLKPCTRVIT